MPKKTTGKTKVTLPLLGKNEQEHLTASALRSVILHHLTCSINRLPTVANELDYYKALALTVRDKMSYRWAHTARTYFREQAKIACYLSAEFLMGPHLGNNLVNLGIEPEVRQAVSELGLDLDNLLARRQRDGDADFHCASSDSARATNRSTSVSAMWPKTGERSVSSTPLSSV